MAYNWKYCSVGGVVRVNVSSGEDIAHLGELDEKLWTVLSCPANGLQFDEQTLKILDTNSDGRIHVNEVVDAAQWLTSLLKNKDLILDGSDSLPLSEIDDSTEHGKRIYDSAGQILSNLGKESDVITLADTSDSVAIFKGTRFNGDGVITPASADDPLLKEVIEAVISCTGSRTDRSGVPGIDSGLTEQFFASLKEYSVWRDSACEATFPYNDNTEAAYQACEAIRDKVADYFLRCGLIMFNPEVASALDVSIERISAISGNNLINVKDEIASYPIARPRKGLGVLRFDDINPVWEDSVRKVRDLIPELQESEEVSEEKWNEILAGFAPYLAWKAARKGANVEALGPEKVNAYLSSDAKERLLSLIAEDKALESQANSIDEVNKLMHLYKHFYKFLCNYVIFSDFYSQKPDCKAVFEAGRLFIDQRCCELCIKVEDMGKHSDMAKLSGMFLIYCNCVSKVRNATMDIVAVMTSGGVRNLRPGTNAVFYDRDGLDWDATVTKIVDNPISIRQAFWSPYRKLGDFINDKINKFAQDKEAKSVAILQEKAGSLDAAKETAAQPFDISKFAGIFAALGMAAGALGVALASFFKGIMALKWWQFIVIVAAIMLVISGPACFNAWRKLRKRNLGPVLNANGWAINSVVLVNILFGSTLTSTAKYPKIKLADPFVKKSSVWKFWLSLVVVIAILGAVLLFIC